MDIFTAKKIHCIGIGGIGVSALATLWRAEGKEISGSDAEESEITRALAKSGIAVHIGQMSNVKCQMSDVVVYSDAVPENNIERVEAAKRGIPEMSYAQALGQVSREYKTIVVTGTHGKSTTTAMLGLILEAAGLDPLVLVGSKVPEWGNSNLRLPSTLRHSERSSSEAEESHIMQSVRSLHSARASVEMTKKSDWFVVEGDDYRDHFLELKPYAVVVTSIEWDHPDYFRDLEHTAQSFQTLAEKVPADGFIILNEDDAGCKRLTHRLSRSPIPRNRGMVMYGSGSQVFKSLTLQVPGQFNRYNATAAATAAIELGVAIEVIQKALGEFNGIWRRFEIVGQVSDFGCQVSDCPIVISDYGHHPTAIRETMKAAREAYPGRRLVLVYQPHQHSRTKHLFDDFVEALKDAADVVILSEIYAVKGRMEDRNVSSSDLVDAISRLRNREMGNFVYGGNLEQTKRIVLEHIQPGDVVIFMGAGDIDQLAREMVR